MERGKGSAEKDRAEARNQKPETRGKIFVREFMGKLFFDDDGPAHDGFDGLAIAFGWGEAGAGGDFAGWFDKFFVGCRNNATDDYGTGSGEFDFKGDSSAFHTLFS